MAINIFVASYKVTSGLLTECGKKVKIVRDFGGKLCGQKIDCAGYCGGLGNFAPNKIFGLPLLIKANIEFFFSYLFFLP